MAADLKWYKRDPDAALAGMFELTLEERGAYNTVLDLIYSRANNVPDDDRWLAGWMRVDIRVWRRLKASLIEKGKLYAEDGRIGNKRSDNEVDDALLRARSVRELNQSKGRKSGAARRRNKDLDEPPVQPATNTSTTRIDVSEHSSSTSSATRKPKAASGTRCPEDFWPDARSVKLALELGYHERELPSMAEEFVEYWTSRSSGALRCDWQKVFRNRLRELARRGKHNGQRHHTISDSIKTAIDFRRWEEQQNGSGNGGDEHPALLPRLRQGTAGVRR